MLPAIPYRSGAARMPMRAYGALERRAAAANGAVCDMTNLTGEGGVLAARPKRDSCVSVAAPRGLTALGGHVFHVDGAVLYRDGAPFVRALPAGAGAQRVFAAMGDRLLLWPDKLLIDAATGEATPLEASYTRAGLVFADGTYAGAPAEKNSVTTAGAAFPFRAGDAVTIPACAPTLGKEKTAVVREVSPDGKTLRFYENTFDAVGTVSASLTLRRTVPDLDFLCVCDNRVWGCAGDTVRCSKPGDPFNWNVFDGLSTDAWSAETGTPGDFTACVSFMGYPVFFKDDRVFKVYGSRPGNYELMGAAALGVRAGAAATLAAVGETLFYLSRAGFVRYNGGYPSAVDAPLACRYTGGAAGSDGRRYCVSALRADGAREYLVYDPEAGGWFREDDLAARAFVRAGDVLYALTDTALLAVAGVPDGDEPDFESAVTFAPFDRAGEGGSFAGKYPVRLWLRAASAGTLTVEIAYDGGAWETAATVPAGRERACCLGVPIRRCDRFGVRIRALGAWSLRSMALEVRARDTNRKGG